LDSEEHASVDSEVHSCCQASSETAQVLQDGVPQDDDDLSFFLDDFPSRIGSHQRCKVDILAIPIFACPKHFCRNLVFEMAAKQHHIWQWLPSSSLGKVNVASILQQNRKIVTSAKQDVLSLPKNFRLIHTSHIEARSVIPSKGRQFMA